MSETITIELMSERRAALLLATLRHLEAEYRVPQPAPDRPPGWLGSGARRRDRPVRPGLLSGERARLDGALLGGVLGALLAAVGASASRGAPLAGSLVDLLATAPLVLALGLALGAITGVAFSLGGRAAARRPGASRGGDAAGGATGDVTWLVTYLALERDESGAGLLRTTVCRLKFPAAAEGRFKATLARAAAASAG